MEQKSRLLELDCMRGVAVLLVIFFHITMNRPEAAYGFKYGCMGVDLFFMISGFVIFLTIIRTKSYKDFLLSRFGRLYPAYWAAVTLTALLIIGRAALTKQPTSFPDAYDYIVNLTMVQYYFKVPNMDGPYWTLIIELLFYALMLIIYVSKKTDKIELIGFVLLLVSLIKQCYLKTRFPYLAQSIDTYFPLINHFPLFLAGIIFYKIKFDKANRLRILSLVLCFCTQLLLFRYDGVSSSVMSRTQYGGILIVFFIIFILYCTNQLTLIVNKPLLYIGKISYSLYLIHQYLSYNILIPILTNSGHFKLNFWLVTFIIVLPVIFCLASLMNRFIETPATTYVKRLTSKNYPNKTDN